VNAAAERLERTFNWARVGGAALVLALGPFFPNIGIAFVFGLGSFVVVYAASVYWLLHSKRRLKDFEQVTRAMFVIDIGIVAFGMLVFAADTNWNTFVISFLLVIAGGFRFGTGGAFFAAGALSLAYVAIAAYRVDAYGLLVDPPRLAFNVSVLVLGAYLMSGLLRELEHLRAQRERFVRQSAEAAALRRADRLKSESLEAISHDFRTPLTVIRGAVDLLLGEGPGPLTSSQRGLAESAKRNVHRLEDFTVQLLEMARLEEGQVALENEAVNPVTLLRDIIADHAALAKQNRQSILLEVDPDPPYVLADHRRLSQALGNLVSNAIRYAPPGTPIVVTAHWMDGAVRIEVRDRGPGVPVPDRKHMFEKFFRGRNTHGIVGSGLGLAIARSLVTLHGGTLEYEENPGGGAVFVTSLPIASAATANRGSDPARALRALDAESSQASV
jgi:signal transduction histidine kinase